MPAKIADIQVCGRDETGSRVNRPTRTKLLKSELWTVRPIKQSFLKCYPVRDILRERPKLSYIIPINIGLVNQISAFLKPVTNLFDKLEGVLTFFY